MNITPLIAIYLLVGVGCALTLRLLRGSHAKMVDLALLLVLWPLFGPFAFARNNSDPSSTSPLSPQALNIESSEDLLEALRRADGGPLSTLLPDVEAGRQLAKRLQQARLHVNEIDRLFALEQYSEAAALHRQEELLDLGDAQSASMIDNRLQIIRRLRRMRDRFVQEIHQIREILTQLQIQAEIVRIAGTTSSDTGELVTELVSRIQGLESVMTEEDALQIEMEGLVLY